MIRRTTKRERLVVDVSDSTARLLGNGQSGLAHSFAFFAKAWETVRRSQQQRGLVMTLAAPSGPHRSPLAGFSTDFHSQNRNSCDEQPLLRKSKRGQWFRAREIPQLAGRADSNAPLRLEPEHFHPKFLFRNILPSYFPNVAK
jgi:hypothetical protein